MLRLLQGFRDFILRGNVVDLAVGIVIGAAFTGLVTNFTNSFIKPLLDVVGGGGELGGSFTVRGVKFPWSDFVNGLITFTITSAVLYFVVVTPMNLLTERRRRGAARKPEPPSAEVALLTEIRDSLVAAGVPRPRAASAEPTETA